MVQGSSSVTQSGCTCNGWIPGCHLQHKAGVHGKDRFQGVSSATQSWCTCKGWIVQSVICDTKLVHMQRLDGAACVICNANLVHMQRLDGPGCVICNTKLVYMERMDSRVCYLQHKAGVHAKVG